MGARQDPATGRRRRLECTFGEFERRLARGRSEAEIRQLWSELTGSEPPEPTRARILGLGPVIALYLGFLLITAACAASIGLYWDDLGAGGVLAVALALIGFYLAAAEVFRGRGLIWPAGALSTVAVGWAGLCAYATLELTGVWPEGASQIEHIHNGLTAITATVLVATLVLLRVRPTPLLFAPAALALGTLSVDLGEVIFSNDLGERGRAAFALPVGLAWVALGFVFDVARRRTEAGFAHGVGLLGAGGSVMVIVPMTVPGYALVGVIGATLLFISAFVRHLSFAVVGAVGVVVAVISSLGLLGRNAPPLMALAGILLIVVGIRWPRWRSGIRAATLARLPPSTQALLTRLAPEPLSELETLPPRPAAPTPPG